MSREPESYTEKLAKLIYFTIWVFIWIIFIIPFSLLFLLPLIS